MTEFSHFSSYIRNLPINGHTYILYNFSLDLFHTYVKKISPISVRFVAKIMDARAQKKNSLEDEEIANK